MDWRESTTGKLQAPGASSTQAAGVAPGRSDSQVENAPASQRAAQSSFTDLALSTYKSMNEGKNCPDNPRYESILDAVISHYRDPARTGDLQRWRHAVNCQTKTDADADNFAAMALLSLDDPFTGVPPASAERLKRLETQGIEIGTGVELFKTGTLPNPDQPIGSSLLVSDVVPDSLADKAGLRLGDELVELNGQPIAQLTLRDVVAKLNGPVGSDVRFGVKRADKVEQMTVSIGEIKNQSVSDRDLGDGVVYIRIRNFTDENTAIEVRQALERHANAKKIVLDLRDNKGGKTLAALQVAEMFVEQGKLMTAHVRVPSPPDHPEFRTEQYAVTHDTQAFSESPKPREFPYLSNGRKVAVLVNQNSASGAELVAGALQQSGGATLVGVRTFGKGIGQNTEKLETGALVRYTDFEYYTPNGTWLGDGHKDQRGLQPDVVSEARGLIRSVNDGQLNDAIAFLNK